MTNLPIYGLAACDGPAIIGGIWIVLALTLLTLTMIYFVVTVNNNVYCQENRTVSVLSE